MFQNVKEWPAVKTFVGVDCHLHCVSSFNLYFFLFEPFPLHIFFRCEAPLQLTLSVCLSSVNCLNTKDKIFAPMDDDRPCLCFTLIFKKTPMDLK